MIAATPGLQCRRCSMKTITVRVPDKLKEGFDQALAKEGVSRDEVLRRLIKYYVFERESRARRRYMVAKARAAGVYTDDDVFEIVS